MSFKRVGVDRKHGQGTMQHSLSNYCHENVMILMMNLEKSIIVEFVFYHGIIN